MARALSPYRSAPAHDAPLGSISVRKLVNVCSPPARPAALSSRPAGGGAQFQLTIRLEILAFSCGVDLSRVCVCDSLNNFNPILANAQYRIRCGDPLSQALKTMRLSSLGGRLLDGSVLEPRAAVLLAVLDVL